MAFNMTITRLSSICSSMAFLRSSSVKMKKRKRRKSRRPTAALAVAAIFRLLGLKRPLHFGVKNYPKTTTTVKDREMAPRVKG